MRQFFITIILVTMWFYPSWSQGLVDQSADRGLMVRQIPNSEHNVVSFFKNTSFDSDTIYATIFRPANCPRCDGFLNNIYRNVKKETTKPYILISVYPDKDIAQQYIEKHEIQADHYIFDIDESFSKFLSFSPGYLHVGYILKINKSTGELIVGVNADNVSSSFFKELNNYNRRKETLIFPASKITPHDYSMESDGLLTIKDSYSIELPEKGYQISEILYQPVFQDNHILWNDKLTMASVELELNDSVLHFKRIIEPDSLEYSKFVNLPLELYRRLLRTEQIKNIPLQPFILGDDKYGIAYSLPELWLDDTKTLNYRNKPCYIERSFSDSTYKRVVALDYDFEDPFFYPHFYMQSDGGSNVVVGAQRLTWPIVFDKNEYMNIPEMNPFHNDFYLHYNQPTLALYSTETGKLVKRFGHLPDFAMKTKTGYSFADMTFNSWCNEAVYASVYSGEVFVVSADAPDCEDCKHTYKAFSIDNSLFQEPDSTDYYSYNCQALAAPFLNRKVVEVKLDGTDIHCLIRHCTDAFERPEFEKYSYVTINRATGQRTTYDFPECDVNERRISYGLRRTDCDSVEPFYITGRNKEWEVVTLTTGN